MSDPVAETAPDESQEPAAPAAPATQPEDDPATLKKRIQGHTQAYNRLKTDYEATSAEVAQLREWKRQQELASMTEAERLSAEKRQLEADLAAARQENQRLALSSKYPNAFAALGDDAPLNEATLSKLEEKLAQPAPETDEPYVDPNSPRRSPAIPAPPKTLEDARRALVSAADDEFAGLNTWR